MRELFCALAALLVVGNGASRPTEATKVLECRSGYKDVTKAKEAKYWAPIAGVSSAQLMIETRECQCLCADNKLCTANGKRYCAAIDLLARA